MSLSFKKIHLRIIVWAGTCLLITAFVIAGYSAMKIRHWEAQNAEQRVQTIAREKAANVRSKLENAYKTIRVLAQTLSSVNDEDVELDIDRTAVNGILEIVLQENPQFDSLFTCWEPEAFDGLDLGYQNVEGHDASGRFVPQVIRGTGGVVELRATEGYNEQNFYRISKETIGEFVSDPRQREDSGSRGVSTRIVVPIVSHEKFYGIVGADVNLNDFQEFVDEVDLYDGTGKMALISQNGTVIAMTDQTTLRGSHFTSFNPNWDSVLTHGNDESQRHQRVSGEYLECFEQFEVGATNQRWHVLIWTPTERIFAHANQLMWKQIGLGGVCVSVAVVLLWFCAKSIARPIRNMVSVLSEIAHGDGDLVKRIKVERDDEIGELASLFNEFEETVQSIVSKIGTNANLLADASHSLTGTASLLLNGAEKSSTQSSNAVAIANDMANNMKNMTNATDSVSSRIKSVSDMANLLSQRNTEVTQTACQAADVAEKAAALVKEGEERIQDLNDSAETISKVTTTIQEIAEQTNLLALNATIEAARAGESGKGFAVVASEVKTLAQQSTAATEGIRERVDEIRNSTEKTVSTIDDIGAVIIEVSEHSRTIASAIESQDKMITEIAHDMQASAANSQEVSASISQTAAASQEITRNVAIVDEESKRTADGASKALDAGTRLQNLADTLQGLVRQFKY